MSEANEADLVEQQQEVADLDAADEPTTRSEASRDIEVDEGDALEQAAEVTPGDDLYPQSAERDEE